MKLSHYSIQFAFSNFALPIFMYISVTLNISKVASEKTVEKLHSLQEQSVQDRHFCDSIYSIFLTDNETLKSNCSNCRIISGFGESVQIFYCSLCKSFSVISNFLCSSWKLLIQKQKN